MTNQTKEGWEIEKKIKKVCIEIGLNPQGERAEKIFRLIQETEQRVAREIVEKIENALRSWAPMAMTKDYLEGIKTHYNLND